ncbi:MAG: hypothetical protein VX000_09660, partial [Myxococcota bacterium]|nr:hypothetical protein [Myxococcota bacterium]
DRYVDNGFQQWAYGDATSVQSSGTIGEHRTTGYVAGARGIAIEGPHAWALLFDSHHTSGNLPEHLANVGFIVRAFRADLGAETITTPHFSLQRTYNGGWSQVAFELGLPYEAEAAVIPEGSVITATVEYVVPPADPDRYYGESDHLRALAPETFQQPQMGLHLASRGALTVEPTTGTLVRTHPVVLAAEPGEVAVDFMLTGGLGYVPISIRGLPRPDGWILEQASDGGWLAVDQSVEGNDWWQALDRGRDGFELTFNVPNRATQRYRLRR